MRALVLTASVIAACGGAAESTSPGGEPGPTDEQTEAAEHRPTSADSPAPNERHAEDEVACQYWTQDQARERIAHLCSYEDERVPTTSFAFPAVAADRASVATYTHTHDCCSEMSRLRLAIVGTDGVTTDEWLLADIDADGRATVAEDVAVARIAQANGRLESGGYRAMPLLAQSEYGGLEWPLALGDGASARLQSGRIVVERGGGVIAERALPHYERDSDCCDGGLGLGGRCRLPADVVGVWRTENVVVFAAALTHQMDGCDASPEFHVLTLP